MPLIRGIGMVVLTNGPSACVVAPPPDLPPQTERRPTIVHDAVYPPADQLLREWPVDNNFIVPVDLGNPPAFLVDGFVDWSGRAQDPPAYYPHAPDVSSSDGGVVTAIVALGLPASLSPADCHRIEILVVSDFAVDQSNQTRLYHTPNAVGGDTVVWFYAPSGGIDGCLPYDAGLVPDGAAVPDAAFDTGLIVPSSDGATP